MSELKHRTVISGDGPQLARFFVDNVDDTYITASEVIWGRAQPGGGWVQNLFEVICSEIEAAASDTSKLVVLFYLEGQLAGYTFSAIKPGDSAEVEDFVVSVSLRGRGLGQQMNAITCSYLKEAGCKTVFMEVGHKNNRMKTFVKKACMAETSTRYWKSL